MGEPRTEKASMAEMLSFAGVQFATSIFMAFSSYYMVMFFTEVALIPPAVASPILLFYRVFCALDTQVISIFINRTRFSDGKYRPYYRLCAFPFAIGLAALGMAPFVSMSIRLVFIVTALAICDLAWSTLHMASISMLPYLAQDDVSRTKFMSFSNGSSIFAFILVGSYMLPIAGVLGGNDTNKGLALALALIALICVPLIYNAYYRLKEHHYSEPRTRPSLKDIFSTIGRDRRIMMFLAGLFIYFIADAFKNLSTYYYFTFVVRRPDLLSAAIMAGLLSPLAMQAVIPRLLKYAKKESLIVFGLFAAMCSSLLMLAAGTRPIALIMCIVLYGVFTAIVANLYFAVQASFSDDIRARRDISMSEILAAAMNLCSNIGAGIASSVAPMALAVLNYLPQADVQPASALAGIRALYILCTAIGMALAGACMLTFRRFNARVAPKDAG